VPPPACFSNPPPPPPPPPKLAPLSSPPPLRLALRSRSWSSFRALSSLSLLLLLLPLLLLRFLVCVVLNSGSRVRDGAGGKTEARLEREEAGRGRALLAEAEEEEAPELLPAPPVLLPSIRVAACWCGCMCGGVAGCEFWGWGDHPQAIWLLMLASALPAKPTSLPRPPGIHNEDELGSVLLSLYSRT